jgi:hypothetical protein
MDSTHGKKKTEGLKRLRRNDEEKKVLTLDSNLLL